MPAIKTGEWLMRLRKAGNLTVEEFANASGISQSEIEAIERGQALGTPQDWMLIHKEINKLEIPDGLADLRGASSSAHDEEEINDLEMDIEAHGRDAGCELFYYVTDSGWDIIFYSYRPTGGGTKKSLRTVRSLIDRQFSVKTTLGEAYDYFIYQELP